MLNYKITTQPTTEPVTVAEAMQQCQLTASDIAANPNITAQLTTFIVEARKYAEGVVGKSLAEKTITAVCDSFPVGGIIKLPVSPIKELTSLSYTNADGISFDISDRVIVDDFSFPSRLVLKSSSAWPTETLYRVNPITIVYKTGVALSGNVKTAILLIAAHWFDNRSEVVTGQESFSIPFGAEVYLGQERHPYT